MAEQTLELKIADIEAFQGLLSALNSWVKEAATKGNLSKAEIDLLSAAITLTKASGAPDGKL